MKQTLSVKEAAEAIFLATVSFLEVLLETKIVSVDAGAEILSAKTTNTGVTATISTDYTEIQCNYDIPKDDPLQGEKRDMLGHDQYRPGVITTENIEGLDHIGAAELASKFAKSIHTFLQRLNTTT